MHFAHMQPAYVCIVTICTHTKQMQAAFFLYTCVQFVHILHMCTLHVCCVERNICAAHILRLSIFVRDGICVALSQFLCMQHACNMDVMCVQHTLTCAGVHICCMYAVLCMHVFCTPHVLVCGMLQFLCMQHT